jgi:hypothetical protein
MQSVYGVSFVSLYFYLLFWLVYCVLSQGLPKIVTRY